MVVLFSKVRYIEDCDTVIHKDSDKTISGRPPLSVLLIYIDSSMGRNGFQSINLSISDSFHQQLSNGHILCFRVKLLKVLV
jgi:hypothetical protein